MIRYTIQLPNVRRIPLEEYMRSLSSHHLQCNTVSNFKIANKQNKKNSEKKKTKSSPNDDSIKDPMVFHQKHMEAMANDYDMQIKYLLDTTQILNQFIDKSEQSSFMGLFNKSSYDQNISSMYFSKLGIDTPVVFEKKINKCISCGGCDFDETDYLVVCEDCGVEQPEKIYKCSYTDRDSSRLNKVTYNDKKKTFNTILENIQGCGKKLPKEEEWTLKFVQSNLLGSNNNADDIKDILKQASMSRYYEYITDMVITIHPELGKKISKENLVKINDLYDHISENEADIKAKIGFKRKNSMNNAYLMRKILERLGLVDYLRLIPSMKESTLVESDRLWNALMEIIN